jgi:hypothetical protein
MQGSRSSSTISYASAINSELLAYRKLGKVYDKSFYPHSSGNSNTREELQYDQSSEEESRERRNEISPSYANFY